MIVIPENLPLYRITGHEMSCPWCDPAASSSSYPHETWGQTSNQSVVVENLNPHCVNGSAAATPRHLISAVSDLTMQNDHIWMCTTFCCAIMIHQFYSYWWQVLEAWGQRDVLGGAGGQERYTCRSDTRLQLLCRDPWSSGPSPTRSLLLSIFSHKRISATPGKYSCRLFFFSMLPYVSPCSDAHSTRSSPTPVTCRFAPNAITYIAFDAHTISPPWLTSPRIWTL